MYQDPKRVRRHKCTAYLDDYEYAILAAHADYAGIPRGQLLRDIAFDTATEVLAPATPQPTQPMLAKRGT